MNASQNRLMGLSRELLAEWAETQQYWHDAKSQEFEKRFLDDLQGGVNQTIASIDALERILTQIRNDCE